MLLTGDLPDPAARGMTVRTVAGGFLFQTRDSGRVTLPDLKVVTKRAPTDAGAARPAVRLPRREARQVERHRLRQGGRHGRRRRRADEPGGQLAHRGLEVGDAAKAAGRAEAATIGSVVASDAFFPFADGLLAAADAGATAIIQPGGSMRDGEVIAAADERGLAMVFTGMRHFRH